MPSQGAVYIRDISGNIASLDSFGNMKVNVAIGSITSTINISGQIVTQAGNTISTAGVLITTASSGGAALSSLSSFSVSLRNTSGNGPIWIGGSGSNPVAISGNVSGGVGMV